MAEARATGSKDAVSKPAPSRQALARLMRLVTGDAVHRMPPVGDDVDDIVLARAGQAPRRIARTVFDAAVSHGLIDITGDTVKATRVADAFLKRLGAGEDAFQDQHRDIANRTIPVEGSTATRSVRINAAESPLAVLARFREKSGEAYFSPDMIEAGTRLHADFTRGGLQPRLIMNYEPRLSTKPKGGTGGTGDLSDSAMAARLRVNRAIAALGPDLAGVALDVCCFEKGLETVERERQWPARSAKLMLRTALACLARHYSPPPARSRIVSASLWQVCE